MDENMVVGDESGYPTRIFTVRKGEVGFGNRGKFSVIYGVHPEQQCMQPAGIDETDLM